MFESFSFLPEHFHKIIAVSIFSYSVVIGAYIHMEFNHPYALRPMTLKYLPQKFADNVSAIIVVLLFGWIGYAVGELIFVFTITLIPILLIVLVLEKIRKDDPELFSAVTIGALLFVIFLTLIIFYDHSGAFGA